MNINKSVLIILLIICSGLVPQYIDAQSSAETLPSAIVIQPLFEYCVPPEDMEGLTERANYIVEHFWDPMDFKIKSSVDQNALNDAFEFFVAPMRFADEAVVNASVDKLISNIKKNQVLTIQVMKAAEESLYGPRAQFWNDDLFLKFADNYLNSKVVKKDRKLRYELIANQVRNTLHGTVPPEFDYVTPEGKLSHYVPNGVITVIEFGDPDCMDCRMAKLKMDTDVAFSSLVDKGKINVLFINVDPEDGWQAKLADYPSDWHVGASEDVSDIYDLRRSPSIYVIDREGHVAAKLVDVMTAMQIASAAAQQ